MARRRDPRGIRRDRRRVGRPVPAVRGVLSRPDPDGLLPGDDDVGAPGRAVRNRRAEGGDPAGDRRRHRVRDRDVRARGRVRRRQPVVSGRALERRLRDQRPEDLDHGRPRGRPHPARVPDLADRGQAFRIDHDFGPERRGRARDPGDRDDGRARGKRHVLHRLLRARGAGRRPPRPGVDAADGRAQQRAADHRGAGARDGGARVRGNARRTSRSESSSARRSAASRRSRTGWRTSPPRSSAPGTSYTAWPRPSRRTRGRCSRARRRWPSSRPPRPPSAPRSRGCR